MSKAQYAILRFAKYQRPTISRIESHNERTKETYASNPDIDTNRSKLNFHLVKPQGKYAAEADKQISKTGCKVRKDSVRIVETLFTASPEFFEGKKSKEVYEFFQYAMEFMKQKQPEETFVSAVVHMDEKTPHMHLCFVPITPDGRLSAKEIIGNRKKLTQWQDEYWQHMVKKYPDFERGESASKTGRNHIPPRVFKEMTRLTKQQAKLEVMLAGITPFNAKSQAQQIAVFLDKYIPAVESMHTTLRKFNIGLKETAAENKRLKAKNAELEESLEDAQDKSIQKKLADAKLRNDYKAAAAILERIPKDVLDYYTKGQHHTQTTKEQHQEDLT